MARPLVFPRHVRHPEVVRIHDLLPVLEAVSPTRLRDVRIVMEALIARGDAGRVPAARAAPRAPVVFEDDLAQVVAMAAAITRHWTRDDPEGA